MNNELFQQAHSSYLSKQYEDALVQFTECLQDKDYEFAPGELGLLYHQIGNCLVKLHDPNEAIHAYSQAVLDEGYDSLAAVRYNLGTVYATQNDYENAAIYFKQAADDPNYPTPYKAFTGLGNSYLKLGRSAEAGAAFRNAALDNANPDPTKALLNLGVCFMALDRPMDAIASYESALQFDMAPETRNMIFANMGQAYVAAGKMNAAVRAFESALADKTYIFNDAANVDYQRAVAAVAAGATDEVVKPQEDLSGLDISSDGVPYETEPVQDLADAGTTVMSEASIMRGVQEGQLAAESFFVDQGQNQNFENWGMEVSTKKRKNRGLKIAIVVVILLIALIGGAAFAYTQGYGYPSKEEVVKQLFENPEGAEVYASSVDDTKKVRIVDAVPADSTIEIVGEDVEMGSAKVYVNAEVEGGSKVPYEVSLARDGIGWKVTNASLYFASQHS